MSGTSKKVWLGIRMLRERKTEELLDVDILDPEVLAEPESEYGINGNYYEELNDNTTDHTV
jgi:hypothetical protein